MEQVHARGERAQRPRSKAALPVSTVAFLTDVALFLAALGASFFLTGASPFWSIASAVLVVIAVLAYFEGTSFWPGFTPAQWAWGLERTEGGKLIDLAGGEPLHARPAGVVLLVFALVSLATTWKLGVLDHPLWSAVEEIDLEASIPKGAGQRGSGWNFAPVYYALGAWPTQFEGKPIFLELPYQPGPPRVFPGKILARWLTPEISLGFEGPKTPPALAKLARSRQILKNCMIGDRGTIACARIREQALSRHLKEMSRIGHDGLRPIRWQLSWFTVRQGSLSAEEQAQGFRLSACSRKACQERTVLVSPKGTHQAFILDLDSTNPARLSAARALLDQSIRSLRVSDELQSGRAWADRQIEGTRLREVFGLKDLRERAQRLADAESALLSKISVDPATYESYYYLAHLGLSLGRIAAMDPSISTASDWSAIARPLVLSSVRYAKDVAPTDPRNSELDTLQIEAQKY